MFVPSRPWSESSVCVQGDYLVADIMELKVGQKVAYFFELSEELGGHDWYVGEVLRLCRPHWADMSFSDGKLWCRVMPSERGARWLPLV